MKIWIEWLQRIDYNLNGDKINKKKMKTDDNPQEADLDFNSE